MATGSEQMLRAVAPTRSPVLRGLALSFFLASVQIAQVIWIVALGSGAVFEQLDGNSKFAAASNSIDQPQQGVVEIDDLVWHTPRPHAPRLEGWEDEYMRSWKRRHYKPSQRAHCDFDPGSPYTDRLTCTMPGYTPARLVRSGSVGGGTARRKIPRVIFVTWATRTIGRAVFISLSTLLLRNPDHEMIFMNDADVDEFVCSGRGDYDRPEHEHDGDDSEHEREGEGAVPEFAALRSGASRADLWRMLILRRYGGIYVDIDMTALDRPLPIPHDADVVSSLGPWNEAPFSGPVCVLQHWTLAFSRGHALVNRTVDTIRENVRNWKAIEAQNDLRGSSLTARLTGPGPYSTALHVLLWEAQCEVVKNSYCPALQDPGRYCDMSKFVKLFGRVHALGVTVNLNHTFAMKVFEGSEAWTSELKAIHGGKFIQAYDHPSLRPLLPADIDTRAGRKEAAEKFCSREEMVRRKEERERRWMEARKDT